MGERASEPPGKPLGESKGLREQILRNSKIAITMEIYTEVPPASTREALRKLGQWLDDSQDT